MKINPAKITNHQLISNIYTNRKLPSMCLQVVKSFKKDYQFLKSNCL